MKLAEKCLLTIIMFFTVLQSIYSQNTPQYFHYNIVAKDQSKLKNLKLKITEPKSELKTYKKSHNSTQNTDNTTLPKKTNSPI